MNTDEQRRLQERHRADIAWLMGDERGRRIVWQLLEQASVYHTTYSDNALDMARREGKRQQGLLLLDWIMNHAPEQHTLMQTEARNERANRKPIDRDDY